MSQLRRFIKSIHHASPDLKRRLFIIGILLIIFQIFVWGYTLLIAEAYPVLLGLVTVSFGLGLRHAVDADHIAAIDNTTRKLIQDGKQPVAVGLFFSLGHSTIVILLSVLIAFSAAFIKNHLPALQQIGVVIGSIISGSFLLFIGIINLFILIDLFRLWKKVVRGKLNKKELQLHNTYQNKGIIMRILAPFLKTVKNSWNMYVVGFLFGLSFDTATEVGLLSLSAATGVSGIPPLYILLLPLAFTAAMSLIDTLDGIVMLGAYGWAYINPVRKLYYNMNITFISAVIAILTGSIEVLQVLIYQLQLHGPVAKFINSIDFGNFGYVIIGLFVLSWLLSYLLYKYKQYDKIGTEE